MRQRRLMNQINVVPYIDVMLVLLVIFMVTAPMIQTGSIDIPSAGTVASPPAEAMVIEVKPDRSLAVRQTASAPSRPVSDLELQRVLRAALEANPDQPFLVAASKELPYQRVIDVLEAVRTAGARKVSLQTQAGSQGR
jgi:biopolymer transport protein TolR